jgi:hypothetical protein
MTILDGAGIMTLTINRMPARKVTEMIEASSIVILRSVRCEDNGYGPVGEVTWVVYDERDNKSYSDPFYRLWEAREYAINWALERKEG